MDFIDPVSVKCKECGNESSYSVRSLLALDANCLRCDSSLSEIGHRMLSDIEEWRAFLFKIEVVIDLEGHINRKISDEELESIEKVAELVELVKKKSPNHLPTHEVVLDIINSLREKNGQPLLSNISSELKFSEIYE